MDKKQKLAEKMLEIAGYQELISGLTSDGLKHLFSMMPWSLTTEKVETVQKEIEEKQNLLLKEFVDRYYKNFTEEEMEAYIAFRTSSVGSSVLSKLNSMSSEVGALGRKWGDVVAKTVAHAYGVSL